MGSSSDFVLMESPEAVMSVQAEMPTPQAGSGRPASRIERSVASVRPPPALSPAIATCSGATPWSSTKR